MTERVLMLSDAPVGPAEWLCAREHEVAADHLAGGSVWGVCLDRGNFDSTLADARWLRRRRNPLPVVALVDSAHMERASELFDAGVEELVVRRPGALDAARERLQRLARRGAELPARAAERIIARSPAMRACLELVAKAQRSPATVLLLGETGTGKEVIARAIHAGGLRSASPFVGINCAAFPETLLESELFGYERGAFTGAQRTKRGHFEVASGGTLFLDEIGETSLGFQVKLLRALQESVIRPLGATREVRIDARVIAATNRALQQEVDIGNFRRDLFYRLNVFPIELPPLRGRSEDVVPLFELFLARHPGAPRKVAPDAARLLEMHPWPGNVRELENEVARIVAHAAGEPEVTARMLSTEIQKQSSALPPDAQGETLREARNRFESWYLRRALERHGGRRIATARALGITRECLYKKLKRYKMQ